MKVRGKLKGKKILLEEGLDIPGEVEVEVEISFIGEMEAFGIWKDRTDIESSTEWVRNVREKEWQRW